MAKAKRCANWLCCDRFNNIADCFQKEKGRFVTKRPFLFF